MVAVNFDLRVIALGAGVQSSTMYLLASAGELTQRPDVAIFADTQAEPPWVYEQLEYLERVGTIPIHRVTRGKLEDRVVRKTDTPIPLWVPTGHNGIAGPSRRQCTAKYKIDPIRTEIRRILGERKVSRMAGLYHIEEWIGISVDEAHRAKDAPETWIKKRWPLLFDRPMRRGDCLEWLKSSGHPIPKKSACYFCPYRADREWRDVRDNAPELWNRAIALDHAIRTMQASGGSSFDNPPFLHRSLQPLAEVDIDAEAPNRDQLDLFGNECEGMCGV